MKDFGYRAAGAQFRLKQRFVKVIEAGAGVQQRVNGIAAQRCVRIQARLLRLNLG